MPLFAGEFSGDLTDRSSTLAAANTSQQVMAANANRNAWFVANPSASVNLWINPFGNAAVINGAGSILIEPGELVSGQSTDQINIIGATISTPYTAGEM